MYVVPDGYYYKEALLHDVRVYAIRHVGLSCGIDGLGDLCRSCEGTTPLLRGSANGAGSGSTEEIEGACDENQQRKGVNIVLEVREDSTNGRLGKRVRTQGWKFEEEGTWWYRPTRQQYYRQHVQNVAGCCSVLQSHRPHRGKKRRRRPHSLQLANAIYQIVDRPQPLVALARELGNLSLGYVHPTLRLAACRLELAAHVGLELREVVRVSPESDPGLEVQPVSVQLHQAKRQQHANENQGAQDRLVASKDEQQVEFNE